MKNLSLKNLKVKDVAQWGIDNYYNLNLCNFILINQENTKVIDFFNDTIKELEEENTIYEEDRNEINQILFNLLNKFVQINCAD